MHQDIITKVESGVCHIIFNRPEKKNAITQSMYNSMTAAIDSAQADLSVKVVLFSSDGDNFTTGNDLADFLSNPSMAEDSPVAQFLQAIANCKLPMISAVKGFAVGIGCTLLLHCERVFAVEDARFSLPFINLGLVPEAGSSLLLPRLIGYQQAADLLLRGETFDSAYALQSGIIADIVDADINTHALNYAKQLCEKSRESLIAVKQLLRRDEEPLLDRLAVESLAFASALSSPTAKEAMSAFMEKRRPNFENL